MGRTDSVIRKAAFIISERIGLKQERVTGMKPTDRCNTDHCVSSIPVALDNGLDRGWCAAFQAVVDKVDRMSV
jgi:hypothetical protein